MPQTPYLSQIVLFSCSFAPRGWALCSGQLLLINQNQALFSLLGTTYGGNGQTTFALPDLRGQAAVGFGNGYLLGQRAGTESVTLDTTQLPAHVHVLDVRDANQVPVTATATARAAAGNSQTPAGNVPAIEAAGATATYSSAAPDANMSPAAIAVSGLPTADATGGNQPHENRQPYLALNYCIALQGVFPSQN